jgi:hypothetical protein
MIPESSETRLDTWKSIAGNLAEFAVPFKLAFHARHTGLPPGWRVRLRKMVFLRSKVKGQSRLHQKSGAFLLSGELK